MSSVIEKALRKDTPDNLTLFMTVGYNDYVFYGSFNEVIQLRKMLLNMEVYEVTPYNTNFLSSKKMTVDISQKSSAMADAITMSKVLNIPIDEQLIDSLYENSKVESFKKLEGIFNKEKK